MNYFKPCILSHSIIFALIILVLNNSCSNSTSKQQEEGAQPQNIKELIKNGAIILDVRTTEEYNSGNINGSINIPLNNLNTNLNSLPNKNQPIIIYCAAGARAEQAKQLLTKKGYKNLINAGGYAELYKQLNTLP